MWISNPSVLQLHHQWINQNSQNNPPKKKKAVNDRTSQGEKTKKESKGKQLTNGTEIGLEGRVFLRTLFIFLCKNKQGGEENKNKNKNKKRKGPKKGLN